MKERKKTIFVERPLAQQSRAPSRNTLNLSTPFFSKTGGLEAQGQRRRGSFPTRAKQAEPTILSEGSDCHFPDMLSGPDSASLMRERVEGFGLAAGILGEVHELLARWTWCVKSGDGKVCC